MTDARAVREAFGPCTPVYECYSDLEVADAIKHDAGGNAADWAAGQLRVLDVEHDRGMNAAYEHEMATGCKGHHAKVVAECGQQVEEVKARLAQIGITICG